MDGSRKQPPVSSCATVKFRADLTFSPGSQSSASCGLELPGEMLHQEMAGLCLSPPKQGMTSEVDRGSCVSKGKSIMANVSVLAEFKDIGTFDESGVETIARDVPEVSGTVHKPGTEGIDQDATQGEKRLVQIALKTIFLHVVHSLGIPEPVFIDVVFGGSFQVHIEFKSHQACDNLPECIFATISGDISPTFELAETSAITNAFAHLGSRLHVYVVDLSSYKISVTKQVCRVKYKSIIEATSRVGNVILLWRMYCRYLYNAQNLANNVMQAQGTSDVCRSFLMQYSTIVGDLVSQSSESNRSCQAKFDILNAEKKDFQELSRCKVYGDFKAVGMRGYLYEVDILYCVLQQLNLEQPDYVTTADDEGQFIGTLLLSLPESKGSNNNITVCIEACCPENDLSKANNSAAREALFYLEKEFNIEVVDYNHSDMLLVEQELAFLNKLLNKTLFLGATANKFLEKLLQRIQCSLSATKNICNHIIADGALDDDIQMIQAYIAKLEDIHAGCSSAYQVAIGKLSTLP